MGKRDFRGREAKKQKKSAKKTLATTILPLEPVVEVEVIKKGKRTEAEEEA